MLPQQRRLGIQGGEKAVFHHRHIGGIEYPLEAVFLIERFRQAQNMPVVVLRSAYDQLGALSRRGKAGRVLVLDQLLPALERLVPDQSHRAQDRFPRFVRRQRLQSLLRGQLNVDAHAVRQQAQLLHQLRRRAGDGLGVNIAVEAIVLPQDAQGADHLFGGIIGIAQHTGGEKQPFNIVPPIKADGQLSQLPGRECGAPHVVGAPVDTVLAVIDATVGHQHLQQRNAPPVGGKAVTAPGDGGGRVADFPRLKAALDAAGCAGGVILGGVREDRQLLQKLHGSGRSAAALTPLGTLQPVDQVHQVHRSGQRAQNHDHISHSSHNDYLRWNVCSMHIIYRTRVSVKGKWNKNSKATPHEKMSHQRLNMI